LNFQLGDTCVAACPERTFQASDEGFVSYCLLWRFTSCTP
jgi:hypothetical protein